MRTSTNAKQEISPPLSKPSTLKRIQPSTNPVSGNAPLPLLDHGLDGLCDLRLSLGDLLDGQVLERPGILDVGQGSLEPLLLALDLLYGLLGRVDGSGLEGVDDTGDLAQVVSDGLEGGEDLFGLGEGGLVLEDRLVSGKVEGGGGGFEGGVLGRGGGVTSSESVDLRDGLCGREKQTGLREM